MDRKVFSVSQVNKYVKNLFVHDYLLNDIWIQGEISNLKKHSKGHIYFTLKDITSSINCVLFSSYKHMIPNNLEDGMKILVKGYISIYEKTGQYQLYVQKIQLDGIGILYKRFEELKKSLKEKGYFDQHFKKEIPKYPNKIGIVTSATGAAIRDILNVAKRRNPYVKLVLYNSLVQGQFAVDDIVKGIKTLDIQKDIDVIIVGRGGGSIEDLWSFNEEKVACTIFNSSTPIISAVGHETDFTISDFVSDLRAPTPSAAAELAVPSYDLISDTVKQYHYKLVTNINRQLNNYKTNTDNYFLRIKHVHPKYIIEQKHQLLIDIEIKFKQIIDNKIKEYKHKRDIYNKTLESLSPSKYLSKGYALIQDTDNNIVSSIAHIKEGQLLKIKLADGEVKATIIEKYYKRWDKDGE